MKILNLKIKNRLPVTIGALLSGVAIAGLLSHFIEAPRAQNDFLHDHLSQTVASVRNEWTDASSKIPAQDKLRISQLIARFESPAFVPTDDNSLTGQALKVAAEAACTEESESCIVPVRLNRRLTAEHVNADLRVLNIREDSLRIDFKTAKNFAATELMGLSNEVRNLRFYQTQTGWVLNTAENVSQLPISIQGRENRFSDRFTQKFIGLNYYPATASWKAFWTEFPLPEIQSDIKKAKQINVNAMRIFLTHDYFDAIASQDEALEKLRIFLDLCKDNDIQVLITLFDLRPDYTLSNWAADIEHVDSILSAISEHEAILGVDLKNQPDLDFASWGEGRVEGWLTVMARHIQTQYPQLPVTAGWSTAENAARLHDVFDVVTYHEYQNPKDFDGRLEKVKNAIGDKPVMITELGSTIWQPPFSLSRTEASQAERLSAQLGQAGEANGVFIWTLNDFEYVGREVVGPLPWRQAQQRHFGLYRLDGTPRPASAILSAYGQRQLSAKSVSASQPFQTENQ